MKKLIYMLTVLFFSSAWACDITAPIPKSERSEKAFMLIGEQFLKCIEDGSTVTVNFIQYDTNHKMLSDARLKRLTSDITWLRVRPGRVDERRVGSMKKLNGVSYHSVKNGTSIVKCKQPETDRQLATLGHEVLHSFIGSFHS